MVTIGIDLGDRKPYACVLDAAGDVFWRGTFASTREGIATFLGGFTNATVVMELGPGARSHGARGSQGGAGEQRSHHHPSSWTRVSC